MSTSPPDRWYEAATTPTSTCLSADTYDVIFKHCSSRTHASVQGLNEVIELAPEHIVLFLERGPEYLDGVLAASLVIFGLRLKVAAEIFTIPARDKVEQLASEYLTRRQAIVSLVSGSVSTGF